MKRALAREAGFLIVFEYSFGAAGIDEIVEMAKQCRQFECDAYSVTLATGVITAMPEIDALISENLRGYVIDRISRVCLAVLRCSIWEFAVSKSVETEISINEAVELAKKYGMPEDAAFVNGVLGSVARRSETPEAAPQPSAEADSPEADSSEADSPEADSPEADSPATDNE